jgi:hypothetical protein
MQIISFEDLISICGDKLDPDVLSDFITGDRLVIYESSKCPVTNKTIIRISIVSNHVVHGQIIYTVD